jgi:hypothetical protein
VVLEKKPLVSRTAYPLQQPSTPDRAGNDGAAMNAHNPIRAHLLVCSLVAFLPLAAIAQPGSGAKSIAKKAAAAADGRHDFDFETGAWKTHVSRLVH